MPDDNPSISEAARLFGQSLPPNRHPEGQEALRFARWFGDERAATELRPADIEGYVESFGATAPNAQARADALKGFLAFAHKQGIVAERMVSHVRVRRQAARPNAREKAGPAPDVRLTAAGKAALEADLASLKERRPHLAAEIRAARADGDVRENAPLEAARSYQLVNAAEARQGTGRLSVESPVGQALVGRRVGDEVQVAAPSGIIRFRIERIEG